jgi:hypothetical protein
MRLQNSMLYNILFTALAAFMFIILVNKIVYFERNQLRYGLIGYIYDNNLKFTYVVSIVIEVALIGLLLFNIKKKKLSLLNLLAIPYCLFTIKLYHTLEQVNCKVCSLFYDVTLFNNFTVTIVFYFLLLCIPFLVWMSSSRTGKPA